MEEEGRTLAPPAAPAKRDQGPSAAPEAAGHDNDGSDGVRMEEEGRTPALPAASAKRDQGPSAAPEVEAAHELINLQYMYVPPLTALAGPSRELRP